MAEKINYMHEINKIQTIIERIDNKNISDSNSVKSRLTAVLENLLITAKEMSSYIKGEWDCESLEQVKQNNNLYYCKGNYPEYLSGLTRVLHMERIMLICASQTIEEKQNFLQDYAKYQEANAAKQKLKVR